MNVILTCEADVKNPVIANCRVIWHIEGDASWAHSDDFLAFTENGERARLDFDLRFEAFLFV